MLFRTTQFICLIGLLLIADPVMAQSGSQASIPVINRKVDAYIDSKVRELAITGVAVAVVKDDRVLFQKGYGLASLEWQKNVTTHTAFQIASSSKLLATTLVMKALHDTKLRLNDPIGTFIDTILAAWQGMQIKHLINHSSGLKLFWGDPYMPLAAVIRSLKDSTLAYPIGKAQHYVSSDYVVLWHIMEIVYRKPHEQVLSEEVTAPLGMKDGGFKRETNNSQLLEMTVIPQKAPTYYGPATHNKAYMFIYYTYTAGCYFVSIDDMAHWVIGLNTGRLFPRSFWQQLVMIQGSAGGKSAWFGQMGWITTTNSSGIQSVGHPDGPGLGDIQVFPQQGYSVIVLSNDSELLHNLALASFYIKGLSKPSITRFERKSSL